MQRKHFVLQNVASLSITMQCWSQAWSGTCGVGALEAKLAVALRGGPLSTQTFTTGELPSGQSGANHTLMKS